MSNLSSRPEEIEPAWFATLPGFPMLYVLHRGFSGPVVQIEYNGTAEDLIASGVATQDMLATNQRIGPRLKRIDTDGDRYFVTRYWRTSRDGKECPPYRFYQLRRNKALALIDRLPGAREAIAALKRHEAWRSAKYPRHLSAEELLGFAIPTAKVERPALRIIVDNTKRTIN